MQSCLATMVAVARCCGSIHAREVASLVALSSSNACSRMALILRLCQSIVAKLFQCLQSLPVFVHQNSYFAKLFLQAFHNFRWRFGQKLIVARLPLRVS